MQNHWNIFTLLYLSLGLAILTVELIGVFWHFRAFDTISQTVWLARSLWPWPVRIAITLFLGWLWWHFVIYDGRVMQP